VYIRVLLLLNVIFLLTSCAFVNTKILDETKICLADNSNYQIEIINRETVTGSHHTPFDYGNKSISDHIYTFQVSSLSGELKYSQVKSWLNSKAIVPKSGTLMISNNKIYVNLDFDGVKLKGKVLFYQDKINKCTSAL
jgi:hypothetical protein